MIVRVLPRQSTHSHVSTFLAVAGLDGGADMASVAVVAGFLDSTKARIMLSMGKGQIPKKPSNLLMLLLPPCGPQSL